MPSPEHTHTHTFPLYAFIIQEYGLCGRKQIASLSDVNVETQQIGGSKMQHMMRSFNLPVTNAAAKLSTEFTLLHPLTVVQLQQTQTSRGVKPLKPSNIWLVYNPESIYLFAAIAGTSEPLWSLIFLEAEQE